MAHIRQSWPDSELDFQANVLTAFSSCALFAQKRTAKSKMLRRCGRGAVRTSWTRIRCGWKTPDEDKVRLGIDGPSGHGRVQLRPCPGRDARTPRNASRPLAAPEDTFKSREFGQMNGISFLIKPNEGLINLLPISMNECPKKHPLAAPALIADLITIGKMLVHRPLGRSPIVIKFTMTNMIQVCSNFH